MNPHNLIQVEYETVERVAARFGEAARAHEEDLRRINAAHSKILFSWQGLGRFAFDMELTDFSRGMKRLIEALDEAEHVTRQIIWTFRIAEEQGARLFMQPYGPPLPPGWRQPEGPPLPPGWRQPEPSHTLPDLFRAILVGFQALIAFPQAVVIFIEELGTHLPTESRRLLEAFNDWVKLWRDNPARAFRTGLRWGRKIPEIGDLFTIWSGAIDVGETWWHNRHDYTQGSASRGMAAMAVDATLAFLPAATELVGGAIGGYLGFQTGVAIGGWVGLGAGSSGGLPGAAAGLSTGAVILAALGAAAGDYYGGEVGREAGESVRDWARSGERREEAIGIVEEVISFWHIVPPNARWHLGPSASSDNTSLRDLTFTFGLP